MAQINKPSDYFNTVLYTGNAADGSSTTQDITGVGFQPDWVWVKGRDNANQHVVDDSVRGANKHLFPSLTNSENTSTEYIKSFASDGFQLGGDGAVNGDGNTYVSWNWLASNTTASNTDGSITSTVSANTTSGFSIVSYTGTGSNATIGHGLGVAPKFIIIKVRDADRYWAVQTSTGAGFEMNLNVTEAQTATSVYWNSTDPTSSVFSVGTNAATNLSGDDYIAYVFAPIKGFSKMGSYTGNGSTDGTFIYTGFKPGWVMIKRTDSAGGWVMFDNKRNSFNVMDETLLANVSDAETVYANQIFDFVSNGLKVRGTANSSNASGASYIYMAFAESPLVGTNNIPATAR